MKSSYDFVNTAGKYKQTPLIYACMSGRIGAVKTLIEECDSEIDINHASNNGKRPIMIAVEQGYNDIVKYLLSKGANALDTKKQKKNALIRACQNGQIHVASTLLKHGVHADLPDSSGNTPCHYAAAYGWLNILKLLIDSGATPNLQNDWN